MSDQILNYVIFLLAGLALPSFIFILATLGVARMRDLSEHNFYEKINESVADTLKEQLSEKVITPLCDKVCRYSKDSSYISLLSSWLKVYPFLTDI